MNVAVNKQNEIIRLKFTDGKSLNQIVGITGVSKPYVQSICKAYEMIHVQGLGAIPVAPATPQIKMFDPTENNRPKYGEWQMPNQNAESLYLNRRINDLEAEKTDNRKKITELEQELAVINKKHALLEIDHKTIETKHQLELDTLNNNHIAQKTSGLNGIIDKVTGNDRLMEMITLGLMAKFTGGANMAALAGGQQTQSSNDLHHLLNDPAYSSILSEIYEMLRAFPSDELTPLHGLFAMFLSNKGMINAVEKSTANYLQTLNSKPAQTTIPVA